VGLGLLIGLTATGAAHPVSRAQIKAIAHGFIVPQTLCVPSWLRKERLPARQRVLWRASVA
jgi:hypothetical protein